LVYALANDRDGIDSVPDPRANGLALRRLVRALPERAVFHRDAFLVGRNAQRLLCFDIAACFSHDETSLLI
jgi:hypothetical protein